MPHRNDAPTIFGWRPNHNHHSIPQITSGNETGFGIYRGFSSEVVTGSREEKATIQKVERQSDSIRLEKRSKAVILQNRMLA
jgi:hypothetical protein